MSLFSNLSSLFGKPGARSAGAARPQVAQSATGPADKARVGKARVAAPTKQAAAGKPGKPQASGNQVPAPRVPAVHQLPASPAQVAQAQDVVREAQAKARELIVEAKDQALAIRSDAERRATKAEQQLEEQQRFLQQKLDRLDDRWNQLEKKEEAVNAQREVAETLKRELTEAKQDVLTRLEKVAKMTQNEAKTSLFEELNQRLSSEQAVIIRQKEEETKQEADDRVKELLIDSMVHGATDYVAEYTVSVVQLPSEDVKGKIIGKSGRNIHSFERATGVDIDLDTAGTEVKLSSFDPIRREIARISLERLIKDGRIQPSRIEEVVEKVKSELDKLIFEAGKQLCHAVGVYNLPIGLISILGRFKYRFSYGQNMITHTIEETKIGMKLAHELGLDVNVVKLGCLLHDIGKVAEDPDDSHVALGVKIAKKFNMPQAVIDCIAQHHEDEPFSGPEQMVVYVSDAISGARPGARYENFDEYVKRLESLEQIANSHEAVKESYAIQAGRELRVLLEPERSRDDDVTVLAGKIRDEIQEKLTYPGTVKVTVIRETRTQQVAK